MTEKRAKVTRMLPLPQGDGDNLREDAARLAEQRLRNIPRSRNFAKPRSLVTVALGSNARTQRRYHDAYLEKIVSERLGSPEKHGEGDGYCGDMSPDDDGEVWFDRWRNEVWDTEWNRKGSDSEDWRVRKMPEGMVKQAESEEIPRDRWEAWVTEFLIFAREFEKRIKSDRGRKGQECQGSSAGGNSGPSVRQRRWSF